MSYSGEHNKVGALPIRTKAVADAALTPEPIFVEDANVFHTLPFPSYFTYFTIGWRKEVHTMLENQEELPPAAPHRAKLKLACEKSNCFTWARAMSSCLRTESFSC